MSHSRKLIALIVVLSVALTACSDERIAGNVAVKVNGEAISSAELQNKMRQHGQFRNGEQISVSGSVINSQIDMELLRQAAVKDGLDADESMRARLAESSRFIIATAYLDKQMAAVSKPKEEDVKAYFNQHPERYAEKNQYDLQELRIQTRPDNAAQIRVKLEKGNNYKAFVNCLKNMKIPNNSQKIIASSDQVPEAVLQKLQHSKAGDVLAFDGKDQLNVIFVNAVKPQPATLEQASPMIMKNLSEMRKREAMNDMLKQLHEKAKIEYVPPYSANGMIVAASE